MVEAKEELTVGDVEDDGSTDEKADDLDSIADRLELSSHSGRETHVFDDDSGEGVDHTIRDCTVDRVRPRCRGCRLVR